MDRIEIGGKTWSFCPGSDGSRAILPLQSFGALIKSKKRERCFCYAIDGGGQIWLGVDKPAEIQLEFFNIQMAMDLLWLDNPLSWVQLSMEIPQDQYEKVRQGL